MDELMSMFEGLSCSGRGDLVKHFCRILQCDEKVAEFFLESAAWDVARAVNAFVSTVGHKSALVYDSTPEPKAAFNDATGVAHGSTFRPGEVTQARFEFGNTGPANWPSGCYFKCVEGHSFGVYPVPLPPAKPKQRVPIDVRLAMPGRPGTVAGAFRLVSGTGYFSAPVWVVVNVVAPPGAPVAAPAGFAPAPGFSAGDYVADNDSSSDESEQEEDDDDRDVDDEYGGGMTGGVSPGGFGGGGGDPFGAPAPGGMGGGGGGFVGAMDGVFGAAAAVAQHGSHQQPQMPPPPPAGAGGGFDSDDDSL